MQSGLTPLMCAVESRSVEAVRTLLNGGAQTCLVEPVKPIIIIVDLSVDTVNDQLFILLGVSVDTLICCSKMWEC